MTLKRYSCQYLNDWLMHVVGARLLLIHISSMRVDMYLRNARSTLVMRTKHGQKIKFLYFVLFFKKKKYKVFYVHKYIQLLFAFRNKTRACIFPP